MAPTAMRIFSNLQVDLLLPPGPSPCLGQLKVLKMENMRLQFFSTALAKTLTQLTELSLDRNCFQELPRALSLMTSLHTIGMTNNEDLQLTNGNADLLATLPNLRMLDMSYETPCSWEAGASHWSMRFLLSLLGGCQI